MNKKIFINFQGNDGDGAAAALYERLSREFGADEVFRSSVSIDAGDDYRPALLDTARACRVMLVVIGPHWDPKALHTPSSWVRREISEALRLGNRVIPVLYGKHTEMPDADTLPHDVKQLASLQNLKVTHRDLHVWLDHLPQYLVDLEPELGVGVVPGLHRLTEWWGGQPESRHLPAGFALAGRDATVGEIEAWLAAPASAKVISGPSRYEVQVFVASLISAGRPEDRGVLAETADGWTHALRLLPALIVTPLSGINVMNAVDKGHHVLVVTDTYEASHAEITLPRIPRDKARDALIAHGMELGAADALAAALRKSVRALARRLAYGTETPPWAGTAATELAVNVVLAGAWGTTSQADRLILEGLTGQSYGEVERFAINHSGIDDPLLHRSGTHYQLADVRDAWAFLGSRLGQTGFERWRQLALVVLFGIEASEHLRHGVAQTIAAAGVSGDDRAAQVVAEILQHANADSSGERWIIVADALPLLAEAAPAVFLDAVSRGSSEPSPVLARMFASDRSPHRWLLWALGRLCWSEEHLMLGVRSLARLAELDPEPDSNYRSRPLETLSDALLPLMPFTNASAEHQRGAIKHVLRRSPEIGWQLVIRYLSGEHGVHALTDRPRLRDWPSGLVMAPREDWEPTFAMLVESALEALAERPARWADVVDVLSRLGDETRLRFVDSLAGLDVEKLEPRDRMKLWWSVVHHRKYYPESASSLDDIAARLEPVDLPERHAPLFNMEIVPRDELDDYSGYLQRLHLRRITAVTEVLHSHGVPGLLRLASEVDSPRELGGFVAEVAGLEPHDELFPALAGNDVSADLASGWLAGVARPLAELATGGLTSWDPITQGRVLLAQQGSAELLDLVETADPAAQATYWQLTTSVPGDDSARERYFRELISRDRADFVLRVLYVAALREPQTLSLTSVVHVLSVLAEQLGGLPGSLWHEVSVLLDHLVNSGADHDTVADLELAYFSVLHRHRPPAILYRRMSTDPEYFVRLVGLTRESVDGRFRPVQGEALAALMWCRVVPASRQWVDDVRSLLAETEFQGLGEEFIGQMLSGSPVGADGAWPSEFVRDLIEDLESERISDGFARGVRNDQGMTVRDAYDGGTQERALAAQHREWASKIEHQWPYTASRLRICADGFHQWAKRFDRSAEDDHDA
ncbi:toll/interleukin-1 receptor domain-containing protein [Lentzea cavernae]|uniref:TIR domain-containing protein n=1 Tax=Lentzea cavernae TaxID=2020703 RepID=A0ABQ3MT82_9PSEU|nr:toll/interleukin-1 receptor domain-containing protein [Lentzea cavernae]GHH61536.1 hypothetical protein GCM10017774_87860 [Lentzea cavernae]